MKISLKISYIFLTIFFCFGLVWMSSSNSFKGDLLDEGDNCGNDDIKCYICDLKLSPFYNKPLVFVKIRDNKLIFRNSYDSNGTPLTEEVYLTIDNQKINVKKKIFFRGEILANESDLSDKCKYLDKICCCKELEAGELTTKRSCKMVQGVFSSDVCKENLNNDVLDRDNYLPFQLGNNSDCKFLEKETKGYESKGESVSQKFITDGVKELNKLKLGDGKKGLLSVVKKVMEYLIGIMGSIVLALYVYAGFLWMLSTGNSEKIETAKKIIIWTTLGLVAILFSYSLANIVLKTITGL